MVMVSGMRALEDYRQKQAAVTDVSVALSSPQEKIAEAVHRLQKQLENMKEQRNRLQEVYLQQRLNELAADAKNICIFEEELDPIAARNFVNAAMERCEGICGAFIGTDETGYRYILGSRTVDMRTFSKELNTRFSGKGGGKPEMVQGSLSGAKTEIEQLIYS
jgi:alanyl-tRNA synthetase